MFSSITFDGMKSTNSGASFIELIVMKTEDEEIVPSTNTVYVKESDPK